MNDSTPLFIASIIRHHRPLAGHFLPAVLTTILLLSHTGNGLAEPRACGTADGTAREPVASDALFVLKGAVAIPGSCGPCLCDTDGSGKVGATDALLTLRRAVGGEQSLQCPSCPCTAISKLVTGDRPSSVLSVDIDKDGYSDLLTADLDAAELSILHGRGRGVFTEREVLAVQPTPQSLIAADLNEDGFLDLVVSHALPNGLSILFGQGNGDFTASAEVLPTGEAPINSVAIDLDGDSDLDLVVANSLSDDISVLLGNGEGGFAPEQRYAVGSGPRWVAVADVDGDLVPDAITANRDSNGLSVLHGDGDGNFSAEERFEVPTGPYHISLGDLDGDSKSDLIVSCYYETGVAVLLADENGGFEDAVFYPTSGRAIQTSLAHVDEDSAVDIVVANFEGDATPGMALLPGNGDGTFGAATLFDTGFKPRAILATDIDGDSTTDVIVANAGQHENHLTVFHGAGDGSFLSELESQASPQTHDLVVADFDGDGIDDVATAELHQTVSLMLADGTGHFDRTMQEVETVPYTINVGQIDGDGVLDLVVSADSPDDAEYGQRAFVLFGQEADTFALGLESTHLTDAEPIRGSLASGDVDDDGVTDIVVGAGSLILVFRGQADGSFQSFREIPAHQTFPAVALADVDRDGDQDLIELSRGAQLLLVHENAAHGDFQHPVDYAVSGSFDLAVEDVTGDGRVDVIASDWKQADDDSYEGTISVLVGDGHGGFAAEVVSTPAEMLQNPTIADFDKDGAADFVTAVEDKIVVLPGDARGHFGTSASASPVHIPISRTLYNLDSGRFDSNSGIDLVGAGRGDGQKNRLVVLPQLGNCMVR